MLAYTLRKCMNLLTLAAFQRLAIVATLTLAAASALTVNAIHAAPSSQSTPVGVHIDRITLSDGFDEKIRSTFDRGAKLTADVDITDLRDSDSVASDAPDYEIEYVLSFAIRNIRIGNVYDGEDDPGNLRKITLKPGESGSVKFLWNVPYDFPANEYKFRITVDLADNADAIDLYSDRDFRIIAQSKYIFKSQDRLAFGNVIDEETPRDFIIITPLNPDAGDFKWRVTEWPAKWLDLVEPPIDPVDHSKSMEVINTGFVRFQVREAALKGNFSEDVVITSNAGRIRIPVSGNINRHAGGRIDSFEVSPRRIEAGKEVKFRYRIANDGRTDLRYRVTFVVRGPSNAITYDSSVSEEDDIVEVSDGETTENRTFTWQVPFGSLKGAYRVGIELRNAYEFDARPFDSIDTTRPEAKIFTVSEGAKINVLPNGWQFGSVSEQMSPQQVATFRVTNTGRRLLEWQVSAVPDWAELVSPNLMASRTGDGVAVVRLREGIAPGNYAGNMVITSNGGEFIAPLGVSIRPGPMRTPTATHTPAPAATSTPSPMPTATNTAVPEPTVVATKTHTPAPVATDTPSPMPTATNTAAPEPTVVATKTHTPAPVATDTPSPMPTATATSTAVPAPTRAPAVEVASTDTPVPQATAIQPEVSDKPPGGACSETTIPVSPLTGAANLALLLAPIGLAAGGARWTRSRRHRR